MPFCGKPLKKETEETHDRPTHKEHQNSKPDKGKEIPNTERREKSNVIKIISAEEVSSDSFQICSPIKKLFLLSEKKLSIIWHHLVD